MAVKPQNRKDYKQQDYVYEFRLDLTLLLKQIGVIVLAEAKANAKLARHRCPAKQNVHRTLKFLISDALQSGFNVVQKRLSYGG